MPVLHLVLFECGFGLLVVEAAIEFVGFVEVGMLTSCNDLAIVEYEDAVGMLDGAKAVCDNKDRAAFGERFKGLLNLVFALGVEGRSWFVEDDDRCVL